MNIKNIEKTLAEYRLFRDLSPEHLHLLAGCAENKHFLDNQKLLIEGMPAERFFLVREGIVQIELSAGSQKRVVIQTIHEGEIVGWSWLVMPHRARFTARAADRVKTISFNTVCLRKKFRELPDFGYEMTTRLMSVVVQRLMHSRMQLLDVYGSRQQP